MTTKANVLVFLLSLYTALVSTCMGSRIGFVVVAATATNVKINRAACAPGSDQPQCNDPSHEHRETDVEGEHRTTNTSSRDGDFCDAVDCDEGERQQKRRARPGAGGSAIRRPVRRVQPGRFQSGDVIELYNTESQDIQIVFPSLVRGRDPDSASGGYRVTKTTDGKEVRDIPDRHMHPYAPYSSGDEALCNIGEFKPSRPIIVRCTVLSYEPAAARGAMVLQGVYEVQIHATKANEEYETRLPVWKLQRRYQATGGSS